MKGLGQQILIQMADLFIFINKNMKGKKGSDKAYSIRPAFKDKFRPQEAKEKIEKIVKDKLEN